MLYISNYLQQLGLKYTTVGKSGFITSLYVVIVPLISTFLGRKSNIRIWLSVVLAAFGLYLLSITGETGINAGDVLTFFCAIVFSIYIIIVDKYAHLVGGILLSCIQFFVLFILSLISAMIFENVEFKSYINAFWPLAYAEILSSGVAYTLQIIAQKNTDPTSASLIMSLESVFALIAGMLFLNQFFNMREALGSVMVFVAIILSQLS
ncbi:MAG: DMT family transporter, partial [Ruminococcaceae bacterium]|nr:DMT family transporter [Oscillospiraceae bacterium]